jgi:hypothetical protein
MIDLGKLGQMPYKHYLISKALSIAIEEMKRNADPNEEREIEFMQSMIDMEYPQFSASNAKTEVEAVDILTQNMELTDVTPDGVKIFRTLS